MSGIFFTKDQLVSVTGGVKKSSYSGDLDNKKLYIENIDFKESIELLKHIDMYIRKYSKSRYYPSKFTPNFISKASGSKSSYYSICKYFLDKENCEHYQKDDCIKLVQKLNQYKEALEKHQLNIKQTQDLQSQLLVN